METELAKVPEVTSIRSILNVCGYGTKAVDQETMRDWLGQSCTVLERYGRPLVPALEEALQDGNFAPNTNLQRWLAQITCSNGYSHAKILKRTERHREEILRGVIIAAIDELVFQDSFPQTDFDLFTKCVNDAVRPGVKGKWCCCSVLVKH